MQLRVGDVFTKRDKKRGRAAVSILCLETERLAVAAVHDVHASSSFKFYAPS